MLKVTNLTKLFLHEITAITLQQDPSVPRDDGITHTSGISDVSFSAKQGEVICVLGQSGSGKSTLLRTIAGLEVPDTGSIICSVDSSIGYVSQEYTLWPHLTALQNIVLAPQLLSLGQDLAKEISASIEDRARTLLQQFNMTTHTDCYPNQLSGGQRQRIALLRAIIMQPEVLLLDEITSALDSENAREVLDLVQSLASQGYTMIIATHDMQFARSVSSRVLFLKDGVLVSDTETSEFFKKI